LQRGIQGGEVVSEDQRGIAFTTKDRNKVEC